MRISGRRDFSVLWFVLALLFVFSTISNHDQYQQVVAQFPENTATPIPTVTTNSDWRPIVQSFDGVDMVLVPPGCFMMGSTDAEVDAAFQQCEADHGNGNCSRDWFSREQPAHQVCFSHPFQLDRVEVTNAQFARMDGQAERSSNWTSGDRPREQISWVEAQRFCAKRGARLPTEAEWEYAARGPERLIYPWGNSIQEENVVFDENADGETALVGSRAGGASWVGALDMSGNVWEWVGDWYGSYSDEMTTDPAGPSTGHSRVLRGGSWDSSPNVLRAAYRSRGEPERWTSLVGFRCARSLE